MRKLIDLDQKTLTKLKFISVFEDISVKSLMEKAIQTYIKNKELDHFDKLTNEEKEDLGLLLLLQEADREEIVSEEEVVKALQ
jgi:hypothetical protein